MHAFYSRLLHLQHAHDNPTAPTEIETRAPVPPEPSHQAHPITASTPTPPPCKREITDRDHKPSLHTLIVPRLIESGHTLDQISGLTGIPRALVELIADEHRSTAGIDTGRPGRDAIQTNGRESDRVRRRRTRIATAIVLAAVLNLAAGLAAVVLHIPPVGALTSLGSFGLTVAVVLLARRSPRPGPPA